MEINIDTSPDKFFRQMLELLSVFPPVKGLRPKELDVLAEIMIQNYRLRNLEPEIKDAMLFSTKNRRVMIDNLGVTEGMFNNNLSILRKRGLLSKANKLTKFLRIVPDKSYNFSVIFKMK